MTYWIKRTLTFFIVFFSLLTSYSQYANIGTGNLKDKIWWFNWDGFSITNGASRTFHTTDGLTVTITFNNVEQYTPLPSKMNTWPGGILHLLYNFTDPTIKPALLSENTWSATKFSMNITATRNGIPTGFNFVAADAEASDEGEATILKTNGSNWITVDFYRNSSQTTNPLIGCGTQLTTIVDTYGGADNTGQNPVISTKSSGTGPLLIDVNFEKGGTRGGIAVAFGVFAPIDRGDLPASYGFAHHQLLYDNHNGCNYLPPLPSISQNENLKIGNIAGDADGIQTQDDGPDEDGITDFPYFTTDGTYSFNIPLTNTTGSDAFLTGWFDYDQSGTFTQNESIMVIVPNNSTVATLKWNALPLYMPVSGNLGFRLRLSSDKIAVQTAIGFAKDGEVEDYLIPASELINPLAGFIAPDTVCVNTPVNINNISVNASSYYWNFCVASINATPQASNLGNIGGLLKMPVFVDNVSQNGNYYGFVVNNDPGNLVRLDFGNSLLNTPTATDLGNFGGIIPRTAEGIQVVETNGNWQAIIVGGTPLSGSTPRILKIDFGASLANPNPVATNWGNVGNLDQPIDLYLFKDQATWYGLTVNSSNNSITRFNFGSDFSDPPTAVNLGSFGSLSYPTGIYTISDNGNWRVFVTNGTSNTITRLDFGNSLLNTPVAVDLGILSNTLSQPRDIYIMKFCSEIVGFVVNGTTNDLVKLNFINGLDNIPQAVSLGNSGNFRFPHSISQLFRVDSDIYSLVPNVSSNTITRLRFEGCSISNIPSSSAATPSPIVYNTPGTYNINLMIDEGLPSQNSFCKQIVVLPLPEISPLSEASICPGYSALLDAEVVNANTYSWSPTAGLSASDILKPEASPLTSTLYTLIASNGFCADKEEVQVTVLLDQDCVPPLPGFLSPDTVCLGSPVNITNTSTGASSYFWNFCVADVDKTPWGTNLGNVGTNLSAPVFMDYAFSNGNYYAFAINNLPGGLIRLDFGNSLLNTPTSTNLGDFGGIIPDGAEGIQIVQNEGKWYAIIVGGYTAGDSPRILKIDFGTDISNPSPVATNWGNIGNMNQPIDLHIFRESNIWYGFTVSADNNTITRFNFTNSFDNTPSGVNLGNIGNLAYPTGIYAINDDGYWRVFITNGGNNTRSSGIFSLTRLDFGSSLLNTPVGINLGNPGNALKHPRDLTIMKSCGQIIGFAVNGHINDRSIIKLNFNNDLSATPTPMSLGNIGNLGFPHSISKLFRVNEDLYSFITNVDNHTITRLRFAGCSNASIPNSTAQTPEPISYNTPGTYNINLTINDGLPTQSSFCRQVVVLPKPTVDFSFEQELCNPASISFKNESENFQQFEWNFGNGTILTNIQQPMVAYDHFADYPIKLKATAESGCADSVTKTVAVRLTVDEVITNRDTAFCWSGTPFQLNSLPGLKYCWTPSTGLSDPTISNPVISSTIPATTYYVNSMRVGRNLVTNGDFSAGNTGFESDYNYSTQTLLLGEYLIDVSPEKGNIAFAKCTDHTTGDGYMMVMDGASIPNVKVWKQTISITPNTNYAFSCWIQSIYWENPAKLQFYINGALIGDIFNASATTCNWQQFYSIWNAGDTNQAEIAIVNQNTFSNGNDFALDDISFGELMLVKDSVTVTINANPEIDFSYDIPFCKSPQFSGIAHTEPSPITSWNWNFGDGNSENASVLTHTYLKGGSYDVRLVATDQNTCKDSMTKTIQLDTIKAVVSPDTTVCANSSFSLQGSGGTFYDWSPANFLDNPALPEPAAAIGKTTRFYLKIKNGIGCEDTDSLLVRVKPRPFFMKPPDRTVCLDSTLQLAGGNSNQHQYLWSPGELLDDPTAMNPITVPPASMPYRVTVTEVPCGYDTTFTVNVTVNPNPMALAWKQRDIDCLNPTVYLGASSSPGDIRFEWSPASGVDNPFSANPLASADSTTAFVVKTTNEFGCSAYDQVIVKVTNTAKPEFALANAFSPNGDGVNDCFGIKRWGNVIIHQFTIFNRWGEKVFSTSNPRECWNGMYKGKLQPSGTFVYAIRATSFCGEMVKKGVVELIR